MSPSLADQKSPASEESSEKYGDDILKLKKGFLDMLENVSENQKPFDPAQDKPKTNN